MIAVEIENVFKYVCDEEGVGEDVWLRVRMCVIRCVKSYMSHRLLKLWDNYNHVSLLCVFKCSFFNPVPVLPHMIRNKNSKRQKLCFNDSWLWTLTLFNLLWVYELSTLKLSIDIGNYWYSSIFIYHSSLQSTLVYTFSSYLVFL